MNRTTTLLLIVWNVVLTGLLAWSLLRKPTGRAAVESSDPADNTAIMISPSVPRDTAALKDARIAYFFMDSVQRKYELIHEKDDRFENEVRKFETGLENERQKAQQRYQELMAKDHSYSTQAEVQADEKELQDLVRKLQSMQARGEQEMARLEGQMLKEITDELKEYLAVYNETAGFDYIFSVQNGGQIWVGNENLNITAELVDGLNARYRAGKKPKK